MTGRTAMRALLAILLPCVAIPAFAAEREYCPERPGLGSPACTIAAGRVSVETGFADWQRDDDADQREDTVTLGETLLRVGLTDALEAQLDWTPYAHVRTRDKATGTVERADGVGDVLLGIKANLKNPDGSGLSVAIRPFVTLPVGSGPAGAGDWGAGLIVPVTYDLSDVVNLQFNGEADAAVDSDGDGRHLAFAGTVGLGIAISKAVNGEVEFQAARDDDPEDHATQLLASLSLAWMPADDLQFDVGGVAGVNHNAPDAELYVGLSRRF
jgi:hypothetical protein